MMRPMPPPLTFDEQDMYGVLFQTGYMLTERLQPFARYEYIDLDNLGSETGGSTVDDISILTVGANYYLNHHAAKLTLDVLYAFDPIPSIPGVIDASGGGPTGLLPDSGNEEDQIVVRAQMQLMF